MKSVIFTGFLLFLVFFSMSCMTSDAKRSKEKDARNAELLAKSVESTDQYFVSGKKLLDENKPEEAFKFFEKSNYSQAVFYMALILQEKGEFDRAEELFKQCLENNTLKVEAYYNLGLIAFEKNNRKKAEEMMIKGLEITPGHTGALYFMGSLYFIENKLDKALDFYKKGLKSEPEKTELWDAVFAVKLQKEDYISSWNIKDKVDLSNPLILSNMMKIGQMLGHHEEAIKLVPESLKEEPSIRQELKILLTRSGEVKKAMDMAKISLAEKPETDFVLIDRGGEGESAYLLIKKRDESLSIICAKDRSEIPLTLQDGTFVVMGLSDAVPPEKISLYSEKLCKN